MQKINDTIAEYGLTDIRDIEYTGNFTIKYYSKEDLELLQAFFGVRRSKFDMRLLEKRETLKKVLEDNKYEKSSNS